MRRRDRSLSPRDQEPSAFASALMKLCDATGALGAALFDSEGETVDYATSVAPFDMKVVAAEMSTLLGMLSTTKSPVLRATDEFSVRGTKRGCYVRVLRDGYAVAVLLPGYAFTVSRRALSEAVRDIAREGGLGGTLPDEAEVWSRVDVRTIDADRRRPDALWMRGAWREVEVLGWFIEGLSRGEVGYRARLATGVELTLVREPLGRWFVEGDPGAPRPPG